MLASGVRRSCDTESSSALLSASPRRATSARIASWRSRSRRRPRAIWSAASDEQPGRLRVGLARRRPCGSPRGTRTTVPPVSILMRRTSPSAVARSRCAGRGRRRRARGPSGPASSPGVRTRVVTIVVAGSGPDPVSARTCSRPPALERRPRRGRAPRRAPGGRRSASATDVVGLGGRQQPADGEDAGRLGRPAVGLGRALAPERREPPDREGDDEDEDEIEQLGRVGDDEREAGLREQEVVDEERDERGRERPATSRRRDDRRVTTGASRMRSRSRRPAMPIDRPRASSARAIGAVRWRATATRDGTATSARR